jgi:hypothetical protein
LAYAFLAANAIRAFGALTSPFGVSVMHDHRPHNRTRVSPLANVVVPPPGITRLVIPIGDLNKIEVVRGRDTLKRPFLQDTPQAPRADLPGRPPSAMLATRRIAPPSRRSMLPQLGRRPLLPKNPIFSSIFGLLLDVIDGVRLSTP